MYIYEGILLRGGDKKEELEELNSLMRNFHENFLQIARDYGESRSYYEALGQDPKAKKAFEAATIWTDEPDGMMYYNDQYADMIFNEDWNRRNKTHHYHLMGLENIGLGMKRRGKSI